jgi:NAD kinase
MDRVVIVTKPTRLAELVQQQLTEGAARFVLESRGQSMRRYKEEASHYQAALTELRRQVPNDLPVTFVRREELPHFLFRDNDLIIACGPDGLFANVAKYVGDQPVITVNPDPQTVAGRLMLFSPGEVGGIVARVLVGEHQVERLPFVKAAFDDDRVVWGINDIFLGRSDQVSARYAITFAGRSETQSSSGIIVSTGVGSTGWMCSLVTMVKALTGDGEAHRLAKLPAAASNELVFAVREPFPSPVTGTTIVSGSIVPGRPLVVRSEMPEGGRIFSDGIVERALDWDAGSKVTVSVGDRTVQRVIG